jgi:hypothetical protein
MHCSRLFTTFAALLLPAALASAHDGPRIWVDSISGRLVTLASDDDFDPTAYYPSRVFSAELEFFFGIYTTEFPGFEVPRSGSLGSEVLRDQPLSFSLAGELLYLNPTTGRLQPISAAFTSPAPQMAVSMGADFRITSSLPQPGFEFFTFTGIGDHAHLAFTLLGDGTSAGGGPDGVYALPLQLHATGLGDSLPFFILLGKNIPESDPLFRAARNEAYRLTQGPFIPEPSAALATIAIPYLLLTRRHRIEYTVQPNGDRS